MILIGTSGWSYDDWVGEFYPRGLDRGKWLEFYAKYFHTTEINSTYYQFPAPQIVQGWIARASRLEAFEFSVKMPKHVTHDTLLQDAALALEFESRVLAPMRAAGCLGAILLQMPPGLAIEAGGKKTGHLPRLRSLLEQLDTAAYEYAVEFRHPSWIAGGELAGEAADLLRERNVAVCAVDGPSMPPVVENTARHGYVRFHGRNEDIWSRKPPGDARMNRYDYAYRREELLPWKGRIEPLLGGRVRAYFNNHPRANAAKNAKLFEEIMGIESIPLDASRQTDLSSFLFL